MLRAPSICQAATLALLVSVGPVLAAEAIVEPLSDGAVLDLPALRTEVPAPQEFLGYPLGDRFTHHERIVSYLEALAASSDRVALTRYGTTYEGRPLLLVAISSPANIARLEELRERHLKLADPRGVERAEIDQISGSDPVVVWLGYGVHGNESSSAEAALLTAYVLAAAEGGWSERLEDVIVLIDPLVNPDGRERYVHFFETQRGRRADPSPLSSEHWEPWPGGRQNHYLVDLNRDWAWASQIETRSRLAAYRRWEPQVFVDFHEMWADSTYFFPPAADPISPLIPPTTIGWLATFGRANAVAFDGQGWTYYVGQRFDLFYPGYGDSYPGLRGAVGMTYEMAGHGRAGSAIERPDGQLLTLADRLARHYTTSMATVQAAIDNRRALLRDFAASRRAALEASPRSFLWKADAPEARAAAALLEQHGARVEALAEPRRLDARPHSGGGFVKHDFPAGTFVVSSRQPLGALVRALLEPDVPMDGGFIEAQRQRLERHQRPQFYDITAWSLPLAYNLEAWTVEDDLRGQALPGPPANGVRGEGDLGYLIPPQGLASFRAAATLQARDVRFRLALEGLRLAGRPYPSGTLFVPRRGNPATLDRAIEELGAAVRIDRTGTGLSEDGVSLGSDQVVPIRPASIGLVSGPGISVTSFGYLWHLLDRQIGVEHHRIDVQTLSRIELAELDVIVLPDGSGYADQVDDETAKRLATWIDQGGILVAIGDAVAWIVDREIVEVERWQPPEAEVEDNRIAELTPADRPLYTPGAALATRLRQVHPLASGVSSAPATIYQGTTILLPSADPSENLLLAAEDDAVIAGFAWPEAAERLEGSLLVGTRVRGDGGVVLFAQEPAYRLFWRSTAPLFLNAVMYGPSLAERGSLAE